jgi:hypothetical protein
MIPQRKRPPAPKTPELDFDATQEIDPALVDSILSRGEPTMVQSDFDDTEILLDIDKPAKPAARRR